MTIEIVDFPINSMVIFHSYISLPEGNIPLNPIKSHYNYGKHTKVLFK